MTDAERRLASLLQTAAPEPPESLQAGALIGRIAAEPASGAPHHVRRGIIRWTPPMLAAASVLAVVVGLAATAVAFHNGAALPSRPSAAHSPTGGADPSPPDSPTRTAPGAPPRATSSRTSTPTHHPTNPGNGAVPVQPDGQASHPGGSTSKVSGSTTTPPPPLPTCATSDLSGRADPPIDVSATTTSIVFELDNAGADCQLEGFPAVTLVDGAGQQIGAPAIAMSGATPVAVTLSSGRSAYFRLDVANASAPCSQASSTVISPPAGDASLTVSYQADFCPDAQGGGLSVSPISASRDIQ